MLLFFVIELIKNCFVGEHFGAEFTKLNPFQKVPVLEKDGFVLTERLLRFSIFLFMYVNKLIHKVIIK